MAFGVSCGVAAVSLCVSLCVSTAENVFGNKQRCLFTSSTALALNSIPTPVFVVHWSCRMSGEDARRGDI